MNPRLTAFALLGLAVPSSALAGKPTPWVLPYPSGYVSGPATQVCVGMFSDDKVADGALLAGGDVFLLYAPDRVTSYTKLDGPFSSMAKVNLQGCPAAEGLLASSSAGLELLQWDGSRQLTATSVSNSSDWADVVELQVIPGESDGTQWICGLSSSRARVYFAEWDGTGITANGTGTLGLDAAAESFAALDWDGDTIADFAVDYGSGVRVCTQDGTELYTVDNDATGTQLLRFPHAGETDNLVWLTQNPYGSGQILTVIHSSNGSLEAPIFCAAGSVGRLTLADLDANDLKDLVVTLADDDSAVVLYHQASGGMSFGLVSPVLNEYHLPALDQVYGGGSGIPVVAGGDLDGDGDEDLLYAGQPGCADTAMIWFGMGVHEDWAYGPHNWPVVKAWVYDADYEDWSWPAEPQGGGADLAQLDLDLWEPPTSGPSSAATDVRVTVWARSSASSGMDSVCLVDTFEDPADDWIHVAIPLPTDLSNGLPQYLVVQVSYVERQGTAVTKALPAWTGQFDRVLGPPPIYGEGGGAGVGPVTTGGVQQPPPPPSGGGTPTP